MKSNGEGGIENKVTVDSPLGDTGLKTRGTSSPAVGGPPGASPAWRDDVDGGVAGRGKNPTKVDGMVA